VERNSTQFAESFAIGHLASQDGHPAHWPCAANWPYILAMIAFQYVCASIPRLRIWTANSLNVWHLPKIVFFSAFPLSVEGNSRTIMTLAPKHPRILHSASIQTFASICGSFFFLLTMVMTFYQKTLKCVAARKQATFVNGFGGQFVRCQK